MRRDPPAPAAAGYGQVVAQGQQLSSLILQIVDELRVFTIFPRQRLLQHRDRGTNSIFSDRRSAPEDTGRRKGRNARTWTKKPQHKPQAFSYGILTSKASLQHPHSPSAQTLACQ